MKKRILRLYIYPLRHITGCGISKEQALVEIREQCKAFDWLPLPELKDIKEDKFSINLHKQ